jgi:hypothetical protein
MSIDENILRMCKSAIRQNLGSLEDLPVEVANTVANIYYRSYELSMGWTSSKSSNGEGQIPVEDLEAPNGGKELSTSLKAAMASFDKMKNEKEIVSKIRDSFRSMNNINKMINALRAFNKTEEPLEYKKLVEDILDIMKYNIKDVHKKTPVIREIERMLKGEDLDEIPSLYKRI